MYGKRSKKDIIFRQGSTSACFQIFIQCIDRLLANYYIWYLTLMLLPPYPALWVSRQICGLEWDRNSDSLCVSKDWCQTHGPRDEWKNDCIEFIIFFGQPPMITPSINHIQDSHGILSRFPLKGEERRIFLLLKWSYHSGCRLAWKAWQLQPAEAPSGLAVSSAVNDRQAGQPCYSAILLLITQSGMNLFAYLFMDIMPFLCVKLKLNNFDTSTGTAMKKIYNIHVRYFSVWIKHLSHHSLLQSYKHFAVWLME